MSKIRLLTPPAGQAPAWQHIHPGHKAGDVVEQADRATRRYLVRRKAAELLEPEEGISEPAPRRATADAKGTAAAAARGPRGKKTDAGADADNAAGG